MTGIKKSIIDSGDYVRTIFDNIPISVYVWKKKKNDFVLVDFNTIADPEKKGLFNVKEGMKESEIFEDRLDFKFIDNLNSCFIKQQNTSIETRYKIKGTNESKLLMFTFVFVPPDIVLVFVEDITEKKSIQQNLIDVNRKLEALNIECKQKVEKETKKSESSEERFRLILENAYDLITISDEKFKFEYVNEKALREMLGYSYEEFIGKRLFKFVHLEDQQKVLHDFIESYKSGKGSSVVRIQHKKGHYIWVETRGTMFVDNDGNPKSLVITRNINDRKEMEQNLIESEKKYREAYDQANFYKDLFTHDMNNILQNMSGFAELIMNSLDDSKNSKKVKDFASIIKQQVNSGSRLITNVRMLSEIQDSKLSLKPIEINHLLINSIALMNKISEDKHLDIKIIGLDEKFIIRANDLLKEVFDNLLINAIKYNENPSVDVLIKISREMVDRKKFIKMEFIDNGMGIVDERKKVIFERGKREFIGYKGMGIGLSLVKKIIDIYNGEIWVEDNVKGDHTKGSNFIILLPE